MSGQQRESEVEHKGGLRVSIRRTELHQGGAIQVDAYMRRDVRHILGIEAEARVGTKVTTCGVALSLSLDPDNGAREAGGLQAVTSVCDGQQARPITPRVVACDEGGVRVAKALGVGAPVGMGHCEQGVVERARVGVDCND